MKWQLECVSNVFQSRSRQYFALNQTSINGKTTCWPRSSLGHKAGKMLLRLLAVFETEGLRKKWCDLMNSCEGRKVGRWIKTGWKRCVRMPSVKETVDKHVNSSFPMVCLAATV